MPRRLGPGVLLLSTVMLALFLTGCPKRPATTAVSAPAPAGPALAAPAPGAGAATATPGGPGAAGATPTRPGTSSATPPHPSEFTAHPALKDIYFDFDKYDIRPGGAKILTENATWLKAHASTLLLIEGHCDERGTNEYNLALGERRAKAAMNYLVSQGVQANRINTVTYGEERPVCTEHNEACWAQNRRAHFLVKGQ